VVLTGEEDASTTAEGADSEFRFWGGSAYEVVGDVITVYVPSWMRMSTNSVTNAMHYSQAFFDWGVEMGMWGLQKGGEGVTQMTQTIANADSTGSVDGGLEGVGVSGGGGEGEGEGQDSEIVPVEFRLV
jgi:hypothetical protein